MLAKGSDVDAVDEKGMTALHMTAANGHMVMMYFDCSCRNKNRSWGEKCQRETRREGTHRQHTHVCHIDTGSGD